VSGSRTGCGNEGKIRDGPDRDQETDGVTLPRTDTTIIKRIRQERSFFVLVSNVNMHRER
jgi:hypothetical protein